MEAELRIESSRCTNFSAGALPLPPARVSSWWAELLVDSLRKHLVSW